MYAKFDKLAAELSDDEDEPRRPNVTRLAGPTRVTIGPGGASVAEAEQPQAPPQPPPRWEPRPDPTVGPVRACVRLWRGH
jgi:hypothetical protein